MCGKAKKSGYFVISTAPQENLPHIFTVIDRPPNAILLQNLQVLVLRGIAQSKFFLANLNFGDGAKTIRPLNVLEWLSLFLPFCMSWPSATWDWVALNIRPSILPDYLIIKNWFPHIPVGIFSQRYTEDWFVISVVYRSLYTSTLAQTYFLTTRTSSWTYLLRIILKCWKVSLIIFFDYASTTMTMDPSCGAVRNSHGTRLNRQFG